MNLPEDIAHGLEAKWKDLPRAALESLALEGYRSGALTAMQVRQLLGFSTRYELDGFLKQHGVYLNYTASRTSNATPKPAASSAAADDSRPGHLTAKLPRTHRGRRAPLPLIRPRSHRTCSSTLAAWPGPPTVGPRDSATSPGSLRSRSPLLRARAC